MHLEEVVIVNSRLWDGRAVRDREEGISCQKLVNQTTKSPDVDAMIKWKSENGFGSTQCHWCGDFFGWPVESKSC